jgi:hypothetical protein
MTWLAELLRVTVFPVRPLTEVNTSWWQEQVGSPPDQRQLQPKALQSIEVGSFGGGELVLVQEPLSLHWAYRVPQGSVQPLEEPPTLGELEATLPSFQQIVTTWLEAYPLEIKRLGFGGVFVHPVADEVEGRRVQAELLPVLRFDPERDREVLLRINRRRASDIEPGLWLNRLSTWSLRQNLVFAFAAGPGGLAQAPVRNSLACQVEVDFNTDQDRSTAIPSDDLVPILRELISDAIAVSSEGIR